MSLSRSERREVVVRSFLYLHTGDVAATRRFYSELLGLDEIVASDKVVGYRIGTLQLTIAKHEDARMGEGWSQQLGWTGGASASPSFGLEVADEQFANVVGRLRAASTLSWSDEPTWVGYWSFPVADPMGNTMEVSAVGSDAWPSA